MNGKSKVVNREIHEEMIGVLTAISIVSRRLAHRLLQIDGNEHKESAYPPEKEAKA